MEYRSDAIFIHKQTNTDGSPASRTAICIKLSLDKIFRLFLYNCLTLTCHNRNTYGTGSDVDSSGRIREIPLTEQSEDTGGYLFHSSITGMADMGYRPSAAAVGQYHRQKILLDKQEVRR